MKLLHLFRAIVAFFDRDPMLERAKRVGDELREDSRKSAENPPRQQI